MLNFRLLTRTGEIYRGEADSVSLPGASGAMEILDRHVPLISVIDTGVISVRRGDSLREFTISSGLAFLVNDDLTVFSDASETADQIDMARAAAAKKKALEDIETHRAADQRLFNIAREHLRRAENRIKLVQRQKGRRAA
jgi:F-type H+-transporting ATPase subunit epsilon